MADPWGVDDSNSFGGMPPAPDPNDPNWQWDYSWLNPYGKFISNIPNTMPGPLMKNPPASYFPGNGSSRPLDNWAIPSLSSTGVGGSPDNPYPFARPLPQPGDDLRQLEAGINAAPVGLNNTYQGPDELRSTPQMTGPLRDPAMIASNLLAGTANWAGSAGDLEQSALRAGNALLQKYFPPSVAYVLEAPIKAPVTRLLNGKWPEIDNGDVTFFPITEQVNEPLTHYGLIDQPDLTPQND